MNLGNNHLQLTEPWCIKVNDCSTLIKSDTLAQKEKRSQM